jgi:carboxyl-terminal processing protease
MKPRLRPILPLLAFALASAATPTAAQLRCENIPQLARQYLKNHVSQSLLSPEVEERTIDTYLRRNDPSRSLLLSRDVAQARVSMAGVFNRMREGDCSQLMSLQTRLIERHQQTEEFVRAFVTRDDYAIDESVELLLDPDKRGYPKTAEERDDLVRSLVHFQISNYLGAGEPLDEAKRRLVHRYELRSRRVAELEEVELYSSFMDSFAMSLDPHSNYLSSDVLEDFRITMSLSLRGRPPTQGQDHRRRRGRERSGQHHRHAAPRSGEPDPRQEGKPGPPHGPATGREDRALPAHHRARQDRPGGAGREAPLRDA